MPFTPDELLRYQRHLSLRGFGPAAQERLKQSAVLVVGAGGLGCPALLYLAAAGVGRIVIIDSDRVDVSNLQRQVLYTSADAGQPKATAAAARLRALNPCIAIEPHVARFTRTNALDLVRAVDVVVDGSDNFGTRYLVNDACVLADRPFVYSAISEFEGQLSVFNWRGGPTYRCLFPEPPEPGTVANCADAGVLGVLPGLIGTAQACETIKLLAGIGEPLSGRLMLWDALTMRMQLLTFAADPRSREIHDLPPDGYGETCAVPAAVAGASIAAGALPDEIDATELRAIVRDVQLLDVREEWEHALGRIEPSVNAPLSRLQHEGGTAALASLDPARPVIAYCAVGARSLRALPLLRAQGFTHVRSLRGGIKAWRAVTGT
jgi:sulfur-carrier protein adenylyltransferase/sulfurtransferase